MNKHLQETRNKAYIDDAIGFEKVLNRCINDLDHSEIEKIVESIVDGKSLRCFSSLANKWKERRDPGIFMVDGKCLLESIAYEPEDVIVKWLQAGGREWRRQMVGIEEETPHPFTPRLKRMQANIWMQKMAQIYIDIRWRVVRDNQYLTPLLMALIKAEWISSEMGELIVNESAGVKMKDELFGAGIAELIEAEKLKKCFAIGSSAEKLSISAL